MLSAQGMKEVIIEPTSSGLLLLSVLLQSMIGCSNGRYRSPNGSDQKREVIVETTSLSVLPMYIYVRNCGSGQFLK